MENICENVSDNKIVDILKKKLIYVKLPIGQHLIRGVIESPDNPNFLKVFKISPPDSTKSNIKYYGYFENNQKKFVRTMAFVKQYATSKIYEAVETTKELNLLHIPYPMMNNDEIEIGNLLTNYSLLSTLVDMVVKHTYLPVMKWALYETFFGFYSDEFNVPKVEKPGKLEDVDFAALNSDLIFNLFIYCAGFDGFVRLDLSDENSVMASSQEVSLNNFQEKVKPIDIKKLFQI